jgi:hypothetical protein
MSDFMTALVDLLPEHSKLKDTRNPLRKVLDLTVGEWFDNHDVQDFYEQLFLQSATGEWLNLHGRDYGVVRQLGESDEDYRIRIVQEKLEYLTPEYLDSVFDLVLYSYVEGFDASENTLTSDNPYIDSYGYMTEMNDTVFDILNRKFVLDSSVYRLIGGVVDD